LVNDVRKRQRSDKWNTGTAKPPPTNDENDEESSSDNEAGSDNGQTQPQTQTKNELEDGKAPHNNNIETAMKKDETSQTVDKQLSPLDQFSEFTSMQIANFRNNLIMFIAVAKKKQLGMAGLKFLIYLFVLYCLWKIINSNENNRRRLRIIVDDFKTMLQMGIGKSKISS